MTPPELVHRLVARTGALPPRLAPHEAQLALLLNDDTDGWLHFFVDPARADALFSALGADADERAILREAASTRLGTVGGPRVVVALYDLPGSVPDMLAALLEQALAGSTLQPVQVLVSPAQYGQVPMAYAERVRLVRVLSPQDASAEIARWPAALVLSAAPPRVAEDLSPDLGRWAAIDWVHDRFVLEPADAIAAFTEVGRLPRLPVVPESHQLERLGVPAALPQTLLSGPALRIRLVELAAGTARGTASERLGEALAYGTGAASTDEERVEVALAAHGLPAAVTVDASALERALARAAVRQGPTQVLREGGRWYVLNGELPVALQGRPDVSAHRFEARPTALRRLAVAVAKRTAVDWELDPCMDQVLDTLDMDGAERRALLHARAWLVYGRSCPVKPSRPHPEGYANFVRLLLQPAPRAGVRLPTSISVDEGRTSFSWATRPRNSQCARGLLFSARDPSVLTRSAWAQVPAVGEVQWHSRDRTLVLASLNPQPMGERLDQRRRGGRPPLPSPWTGHVWEGDYLIPGDAPVNDDAWLDALEAAGDDDPMTRLRARHEAGERLDRARLEDARAASAIRTFGSAWPAGGVDVEPALRRADNKEFGHDVVRCELTVHEQLAPPWEQLDTALLMAWAALRRATQMGDALQASAGRVLLPLGNGVIAELTISAAQDWGPVRAAFTLASQRRLGELGSVEAYFAPVYVWPVSTGVQVGVNQPESLHILGEGLHCVIRFLPDPYALGASGTSSSVAPLQAARAAEQERARRAREED